MNFAGFRNRGLDLRLVSPRESILLMSSMDCLILSNSALVSSYLFLSISFRYLFMLFLSWSNGPPVSQNSGPVSAGISFSSTTAVIDSDDSPVVASCSVCSFSVTLSSFLRRFCIYDGVCFSSSCLFKDPNWSLTA